MNILKNLKTTTTENETRTVIGNLVNKVVGTTNDTRIGMHHQTNISPRFENYVHTLTQDRHEKLIIHQPTSTWDIVNTLFSRKILTFSATGMSFSATGTSTSVGAVDASGKVISVSNNAWVAERSKAPPQKC